MIVILKGDDVSKTAIAEIEEAKKRVESIERVSETLKSLSKEDLIAQTLLRSRDLRRGLQAASRGNQGSGKRRRHQSRARLRLSLDKARGELP